MKVAGMLVGKSELNPYRRPIWAWLRLNLASKGDHTKTNHQVRATVILIALKIDSGWFFHIDISLNTTLSDG